MMNISSPDTRTFPSISMHTVLLRNCFFFFFFSFKVKMKREIINFDEAFFFFFFQSTIFICHSVKVNEIYFDLILISI